MRIFPLCFFLLFTDQSVNAHLNIFREQPTEPEVIEPEQPQQQEEDIKPPEQEPKPQPQEQEEEEPREPINIDENTYGYAQVHDTYKQYYFASNNTACTKPTHSILYAKKNMQFQV